MTPACCLKRRSFLKAMFAGASYGAAHLAAPRIAMAQAVSTPKNLVVVDLRGGMDGLFAMPYVNSLYDVVNSLRGSLAVTTGIHAVSSTLGLHPNWAPLVFAHSSGYMKLIQNVGYSGSANFSHEGATKQVQALNPTASGGSSGFLSLVKENYQNAFGDYSIWGFQGGDFIFQPAGVHPALIVNSLRSYSYNRGPFATTESDALRQASIDLLNIAPIASADSAERRDIVSTGLQSHAAVPRIAEINNIPLSGVYVAPGGQASSFSNSMQDIVKVIKDNQQRQTGKHVLAYASIGGFDNHADLQGILPGLITEIANALAGTVQDLASTASIFQNTAIVVISEFGRTIKPNGSGTDHGSGNVCMVLGGRVNGGSNILSGVTPTAADMTHSRDYLEPTMDWRNIFGEVFNWMGFDSNIIIPGGFQLPTNPALRPNIFLP